MDKKEQRKELELLLIKTIESVLAKQNAEVAAKIRKTTFSASKSIAKKFYKASKVASPKKKSHLKSSSNKAIATKAVSVKIIKKAPIKKVATKSKK